MGSPQLAGAAGGFGDKGCELGLIGNAEGDVRSTAAADRPAVRLRCEVSVREKPDIERGQRELLSTPHAE